MEVDELDFSLPTAPADVHFDKNDFVKSNFSVDDFLEDHKGVPLETMRDDLGAYLKVLRLAMIDLINRDYANFVSLSATLIQFDKWIEKLEQPLTQLTEDVMSVKQNVEDSMKELSLWLNQKKSLHHKKIILKYYIETQKHLQVLSSTLDSLDNKELKESIICAERAVSEYNKLQFCLNKCNDLVKTEDQIKCADLGEKLFQKLLDALLLFYKSNDKDGLLHTLQTSASLNKINETEEFVRKKIISVYLQEIISETNLQKCGLSSIYDQILGLLNSELKLLLSTACVSTEPSFTVNFQFIINSFWIEVERQLEVQLSSIFAPGNPNIFYCRYSDSIIFLNKFECHCNNEQKKLMTMTKEYKSFMKRWNLPVYYQIRFQEIAGAYESVLSEFPPEAENKKEFNMKASLTCWESLEKCWKDGIFIEGITNKFLKLSLQLISRYALWVVKNCEQKSSSNHTEVTNINKDLIKLCIYMYIDCMKLIEKLSCLLDIIKNRVKKVKIVDIIQKNLNESKSRLKEVNPIIRNCIVEEISRYSISQLKQVSDIPRLYRKTNRSVPNSPCNYINVVSDLITSFVKENQKVVEAAFIEDTLVNLFSKTTSLYFKSVEDVLTSVKKTEESLRRLKQIKHGVSQNVTESSSGTSDGDKIRMQLNLDVHSYCKLMKEVGVDAAKIDYANQLVDLVRNIVNN